MPLPYLTSGVSPIAGEFRRELEDFRVDELPAYEPSGQGTHLFVHIEKRDLTTQEAIKRLARQLGVDPRAAGYAGMKDRRAVTTQWLSLEGAQADAALALELDGIQVLAAVPHGQKLRTGHLEGNRFKIRVRGVDPSRIADAQTVFERLVADGVPNYYGDQRFGADGGNVERARAWIVDGGRAPRAPFERKMLVSSLQSALFNQRLAARVEAGELGKIFPGELVRKEDTGGVFIVEDVAEAQSRSDTWALSPTGPMFGAKMRWPEGEARAQEEALMAEFGLTHEHLDRIGRAGPGARRVVRFRLAIPEFTPNDDGFTLGFTLPAGSYATVVLREILKEDAAPDQKR